MRAEAKLQERARCGLQLDTALATRVLEGFLRDELGKFGFERAVVAVSGGIDSALTCTLAAQALGADNVLAVLMPYRTSNPASRADAELAVRKAELALQNKSLELDRAERMAADKLISSQDLDKSRYDKDVASFEAIWFINDYDNLVGTVTESTGGGGEIGDQFDAGEVAVSGIEMSAGYMASIGNLQMPLDLRYTWTNEFDFQNAFESGFDPWGTVEVGDELRKGVRAGYTYLESVLQKVESVNPSGWLRVLAPESAAEHRLRSEFDESLGPGEASCLALAILRGLTFATDDLAARRLAAKRGALLTGTLGILIKLVRSSELPLSEANAILVDMIRRRYRSPVERLDEYV